MPQWVQTIVDLSIIGLLASGSMIWIWSGWRGAAELHGVSAAAGENCIRQSRELDAARGSIGSSSRPEIGGGGGGDAGRRVREEFGLEHNGGGGGQNNWDDEDIVHAAADGDDGDGPRRREAIYGGESAPIGHAPYSVALGEHMFPFIWWRTASEIPATKCGGVILSASWVLSTASCEEPGVGPLDFRFLIPYPQLPTAWIPTDLYVTAGTACLPEHGGILHPDAQVRRVSRRISMYGAAGGSDPWHRNKDRDSWEWIDDWETDIMMLLLQEPLRIGREPWTVGHSGGGPSAAAISLPSGPANFGPGGHFQIAGWGPTAAAARPDLLQRAEMTWPQVPASKMTQFYDDIIGMFPWLASLGEAEAIRIIQESAPVYVIPVRHGDTQPCAGDRGTGWVRIQGTSSGRPELVGLYTIGVEMKSFGAGWYRLPADEACGREEYIIGAAVDSKVDWIRQTMTYYGPASDDRSVAEL